MHKAIRSIIYKDKVYLPGELVEVSTKDAKRMLAAGTIAKLVTGEPDDKNSK